MENNWISLPGVILDRQPGGTMKRITKLLSLIIMICVASGCEKPVVSMASQESSQTGVLTPSAIAQKIQHEMAKIVFISENRTSPNTAVVLDEIHTSRAAQIQEAIILERMYYEYASHAVVLEGLFTESKPLDTAWFDSITGQDCMRRVRVAAQLLQEGEIGAAEYWKLVHPEVTVVAAESMKDHPDDISPQAHSAPEAMLVSIAEKLCESVLQRDAGKAEEYRRVSGKLQNVFADYEKNKDNASKEMVNRKLETLSAAYDEYKEFLLSLDPWTQKTWTEYKAHELGSTQPSIETSAELAEAIANKARSLGIQSDEEATKAMNEYIKFMRCRDRGTVKIATALQGLLGQSGPPVAAIIGMGHSMDLSRQLDSRGCSYVILRPLVISDDTKDPSEIPFEMFERKYRRLSVFSEGPLAKVLETLQPIKGMKPSPVLNEPWLHAKAELYALADRIVDAVFGGKPPNDPPVIPASWPAASFSGKYVHVDTSEISLIEDDDAQVVVITDETLKRLSENKISPEIVAEIGVMKGYRYLEFEYMLDHLITMLDEKTVRDLEPLLRKDVEKKQLISVLVPFVLNRGHENEQTLWVKAAHTRAHVSSEERIATETILREAFESVISGESMKASQTDAVDRVRPTSDIIMAIGLSEDIRKVSLGSR